MLRPISFKKTLCATLLVLSSASFLNAQDAADATDDATQLGFSGLQAQANVLVEKGQLVEALPLLKELVKRVEASKEASEIQLDFPIYLIGTAHIQLFVTNSNGGELLETLKWYDKLIAEYPDSLKVKDALIKEVDIFRILSRHDEAIALMQKILAGDVPFRLTPTERVKTLKDLVQTYYGLGNLKDGLPYFQELVTEGSNFEDRALGAAAAFEALVAAKRLDDAMKLISILAKESDIRYLPRLNVSFLTTSDKLVDVGKYNDAAILLNLIKTTAEMITFNEAQQVKKKAKLDQRLTFSTASEAINTLKQEIATLENNLVQLEKLPSLRNDLLVRRARNYTKTERRYEAFWMFYDLMEENPDDPQIQFFTYASFANAHQLHKEATALAIGNDYREKFPTGEYYPDVSAALAGLLLANGDDEEFLEIVTEYLTNRPLDPASDNLLAQWGGFLMREGEFETIIDQTNTWLDLHGEPVFEDGLYYWGGLALLQTTKYEAATDRFNKLLKKFPDSAYAEDGLLRKGASQFYNQDFEAARKTLYSFRDKYPESKSLDQAYFFLGEVENLAGNYELALKHFKKADAITPLQNVHDSVAFRIGTIYETLGEYDTMVEHFKGYIELYGENGRLTDAVYELGRGYEFTQQPNEMLALFRDFIGKFVTDPDNAGVDALIEGYAEKYNTNKITLTRTVEFLDQLENDPAFRKEVVSSRGFLFELFYTTPDIDPPLYNKLRNHPEWGPKLVSGLSPIDDLTSIYRTQLESFPTETPEDFFRSLLPKYQAQGNRIAESRVLMGLYRSDIIIAPIDLYDTESLEDATPRVLLYIADYSRADNIELAIEAWNKVLTAHAGDDAAIVAYMRLADVSKQAGDMSDALNYLDEIVNLFPGSPQIPPAILEQGDILVSQGETNEARQEKYQYILKVSEWRGVFHARALYAIGQSYMADLAYPEAHGFFERTFLGYSHFTEWAARAYLADAEALIKMNQRTDAITTLKEALDLLPANSEFIQPIKTKLQELQP